jgi:hypothetical protein
MKKIKEIEFDNKVYRIHFVNKDQDKVDYYAYFIEIITTTKRFLRSNKVSFQSGVALIYNKQPMLLNVKIQTKFELPEYIKGIIILDYRARTRL